MSLEVWGEEGNVEGGFTEDRMYEAFQQGLQAMREMLARFVENAGDATTAMSIRANWNPAWGEDPGRPETVVDDWS